MRSICSVAVSCFFIRSVDESVPRHLERKYFENADFRFFSSYVFRSQGPFALTEWRTLSLGRIASDCSYWFSFVTFPFLILFFFFLLAQSEGIPSPDRYSAAVPKSASPRPYSGPMSTVLPASAKTQIRGYCSRTFPERSIAPPRGSPGTDHGLHQPYGGSNVIAPGDIHGDEEERVVVCVLQQRR